MDDILLIGNDIPMLEATKSSLRKSFSMKDLGEAAYILGIKIYRDRSKRLIGLSQDTYIDKVLKRLNMQDSKKGFLPMSHGISLNKSQCLSTPDEQEKMSAIPYASAIGFIMYVLSVETHRRAATGNTKSREVAGTLAGTDPSSTARNSSTRRGL